MKEKMIAKKLNKIKIQERLSKTLIKFFKTDKGNKFIHMLGYAPIKELTSRFEAPNVERVGSSKSQMNILLHSIEKAGKSNLLRFNRIVDYTGIKDENVKFQRQRLKFVENYQKHKTPIQLLPYDQKLLNMRDQWRVKRDNKGYPIYKTVIDNNPDNVAGCRILYDTATNKPIYKFTPKPHGMGLAYKLHAYEEHKMAKYDKRMAIQMELDKKSDLFPEQISQKYKMLREAHLEQVRRDLSNLYCPGNITVVVQDKDTEDVKKIPIDTPMRLGVVRPYKLTRRRTKEQFMAISKAILKDNENSRVTCIHVDYNKCGPSTGKVIISSLYGLAA